MREIGISDRYSSRETGTVASAAASGVCTTPGSTEFTRIVLLAELVGRAAREHVEAGLRRAVGGSSTGA